MRILFADSDESLKELLQQSLAEQSYSVDVVSDGESATSYCSFMSYDLLILNAGLPIDGIGLCKQLRQQGNRVPILLLTEQDNSLERVNGLNAGADDCFTKPFNLEEFHARVRTLLRRESLPLLPIFQQGALRVNFNTVEVTYGGQTLKLTPKEYALMSLFCHSPQRVFTLQEILDNLWHLEELPQESTVRAHIKGLRQKLKLAGAPPDLVETVYGIGYRLKPLELLEPPNPSKQEHLRARAKAWEHCKDSLMPQLVSLDQAASMLVDSPLSFELQKAAQSVTHRLIGVLGSFGLTAGSKLAQALDQLLHSKTSLEPSQVQEFQYLVAALRQAMAQSPPAGPDAGPDTGSLMSMPLLLIVNESVTAAQGVAAAVQAAKIRTVIASTFSQAMGPFAPEGTLPDVVLLKICFDQPAVDEAMAFLDYLSQDYPQIPVLVIAEQAQVVDRLAVAARGGRLFLDAPVTGEQVLNAIAQALHASPQTAKILIVDDDAYQLHLLQTLLAPWRFEMTVLDNPKQFWAVLHEVNPDLVVLDVAMPEVSGIQLCQLLRRDARCAQLPVLFLTAHVSADVEAQVFAAGADDYVSKPVMAEALASRILNRLARVRRRIL
ncbi:MAG: response regulator [Cyanobacteria bacterium P01_A01_bin.114]